MTTHNNSTHPAAVDLKTAGPFDNPDYIPHLRQVGSDNLPNNPVV